MKESTMKTQEQKIVSMSGDKLTTLCGDGKEHSYTLAKDAKVTTDGKVSKVADLKVGSQIIVTTSKDDKAVITAIEAGKHTATEAPAATTGHKA